MPAGQLTTGVELNPALYAFDTPASFNRGMKAGTSFGTPTATIGVIGVAGTGASVSAVTGSDFAGRFTVTGGTGATSGTLATFAFGTPLAAVPSSVVVNLSNNTGLNAHAVGANNISATGFALVIGSSLTALNLYTVTYLTIQ